MPRILLTLFLVLCHLINSTAQQIDTTLWGTNGEVRAIARKGNTIYLGGTFTHLGPITGGGALLNAATGRLASTAPPQVQGYFSVIISDGSGGWYAGGKFDAVGGAGCSNIAHLNPNGTLDRAWNLAVDNEVSALALSGDVLYVGGLFTQVSGVSRKNLAAVNIRTRQVIPWDPQPDSQVTSLAVAGQALFAGGRFGTISGKSKRQLAAFDLASGVLHPWNLDLTYNWGWTSDIHVEAMVVSGSTVYVGGIFSAIAGQSRNHLAAINSTDGSVSAWNPTKTGYFYFNHYPSVAALALSGNTLYAGGCFYYQDGAVTNKNLAAFDLTTGDILPWAAQFTTERGDVRGGEVRALVAQGDKLIVGGYFSLVNGQERKYMTYLDRVTGSLLPATPPPNGPVTHLEVAGKALFAGGHFTTIGDVARNNLAALDAATGRPTEWNPDVNGPVKVLLLKDDLLYTGGAFSRVKGENKSALAAIHTITGTATAWKPAAGNVNALALYGDTIYVGGNQLAAFDTGTGEHYNWYPILGGEVKALSLWRDTLYVGGYSGLVSFATKTNTRTEWYTNITCGGPITDLKALKDKVLVAAGPCMLALSKAAGAPTLWELSVDNLRRGWYVKTIAVKGDSAYLAGQFYRQNADGTRYDGVMKVHLKDGSPSPLGGPWQERVAGTFFGNDFSSSLIFGETVYLGGTFAQIGNAPVANIIAFGGKSLLNRSHWVTGRVYHDANGNCQAEDGEAGLAGLVIRAEPGPYYAITDSMGRYALALDTGNYRIEPVLPVERDKLIRQTCPAGPAPRTVRLETATDTVSGADFGNHLTQTSYLTASVGSSRRRRCMASDTRITYCNEGFLAAGGVKVHLALPEHVVLVSADVPYTRDPDHHYVFTIGTLAAGACGVITVRDSVVCNNPDIRGLTQCTKVWITPANAAPSGPGWDGSDVALRGKCLSNGRVKMGLYNAGTGDMADSTAYRVYLDAQLVLSRRFKLAAGDSLLLQVPANGQTVRLEADQRPGHPTRLQTSMTLEACGTDAQGKVSLGFVAQLPCDDAEPEVAIECLPITDSYDPNDKLVRPAGVSDQRHTALGQALEYTVRFQNTGNDYAYKVVVTDTLTDQFDVSTLRVIGASHPYQFNVSGKGRPLLTWTFNDINLPDSTRDPAGSNGFVKFTVKPLAALPPGTRIENHADIFFDFNPSIRTNTVWNTLYEAPVAVEEGRGVPVVVCAKERPAIALVGSDSLRCTFPGDRYQWFLNEKELPYTTRVIRATQSGDYRVSIMQPDCYPLRSDPLHLVVTGLESPLNAAVTIHPNPTPGRFALHLPAGAGPATVTAWDATGRRVLSLTVPGKASGPVQAEMDLTAHPDGIYILKIETARAVVVRRVAKQ